jgi:hypothetical protein
LHSLLGNMQKGLCLVCMEIESLDMVDYYLRHGKARFLCNHHHHHPEPAILSPCQMSV